MERRRFLAAAWAFAAGGVAALAGCTDLLGEPGERTQSTTTADSTEDTPTTSNRRTSPHSTTPTGVPDTPSDGGTEPTPNRLRLESKADETLDVTVVLVSQPGSETAYEKTHAMASGAVLTVHNLFERGTDYRLTIRIEGDVVFERLIRRYQAYHLVVRSATTVTVGEKHET